MNENVYYASLGRRLLAFFLDALILAIPVAVGSHVIPVVGGLIIYFFYAPVLECSSMQATLGKVWVGIQVADVQGRRISFQASLLRNLLKMLQPAILFLGCVTAFFSGRKQTLHDMLADTVVVYGRSTDAIADAWSDSVKKMFGTKVFKGTPDFSQLEKLHELRQKGILSEEEYQREKARILQ